MQPVEEITAELFDHLIHAGEQRRRHCNAEGLGGNQIDHDLELCRLFNRQFSGLCPAQNLVDILGRAPG